MNITQKTDCSLLSNEEIRLYIEGRNTLRGISTNLPNLKTEMIKRTSFLSSLKGEIKFTTVAKCFLESYFSLEDIPFCLICKDQKVMMLKTGGFSECCSKECARNLTHKKSSASAMEKYGVNHHIQSKEVKESIRLSVDEKVKKDPDYHKNKIKKGRKTYQKKTGFDHQMRNPEIKEKVKQSTLESIGKDCVFRVKETREEWEDRRQERTGFRFPTQNPQVRMKAIETNQKKWDRDHWKQSHISSDIMNKLNDPVFIEKRYNEVGGIELSYELGVTDCVIYNRLKSFNIPINDDKTSFAEKQINEHINSLGLTTVQNDRTILEGKEIDILIPELNLGIEYNGVHWHSTKYNTEIRYHLNKTKLAESKGIRLIHIFEDEWIEKKDIVLDKIANLCGIRKTVVYARKTECHEITNNTAKTFYNSNHIQGHATATKVYGLYHNLQLVACMSFKASRTNVEGEWDLSRFATSCNVIGGFSKLLKRFIRDNNPSSIISFADKRWSQGDLYLKNGFIHEYDTKPNYYYVENKSRVRKENYRRNKLPKKLGDCFDPNLSEFENTERAGIYRIYDCGLMKFRMNL